MCSDVSISVRHLGKAYRLFSHPQDRVKQFLFFGIKKYHREFTALQGISFDLIRGETVGIIGRNGSGKSTLLQIICGILKATSGTVEVNGRVIALLELGSGFSPEFTGRENVYFQGALMGFTKAEMDTRFADIANFAEIGEFIDQPVRTYSSGMFVRLAFSTATHMDPEILILDEALSVGDVGFQKKCFDRIDAVRQRGGIVLLVSHAMEQIAHHCDRVIVLEGGEMVFIGAAPEAIHQYLTLLSLPPAQEGGQRKKRPADAQDRLVHRSHYNPAETRWGDQSSTIIDACLVQNGVEDPQVLTLGVKVELRFWSVYHADSESPVFGIAIKSKTGAMMLTTNSRILLGPGEPQKQKAGQTLGISFFFTPFFGPADYLISLGVTSETSEGLLAHDRRYDCMVLKLRNTQPHGSPDAGLSCQIEVA
ncbi:MAG TPA: ABC transporter ATP-binding protein [Polaromonas sp.]|nr:ABC transporter ATP-binding protein [Polaromonas sp.]